MRVVIVAGDGQSYGTAPPGGGTWKDQLLAEVGPRLDLGRLHFTSWLGPPAYRRLLQGRRGHRRLAHAAGRGGDRGGDRGGRDRPAVDFFDVPGWAAALTAALADPRAMDPVRAAARQTAVRRYALADCLPRILDLVEEVALSRAAPPG